MLRNRIWWSVLAIFVLTAACSSDQTADDVDASANEISGEDSTSASDPVDGEDKQELVDSEPAAAPEPRFDPLPIPADVDEVEDVFRSLLGPTDDFVAQVRRVIPDYRQIPTPPGADVVLVRMSFYGVEPHPTDRTYTSAVTMTSTAQPEELMASLEQALLADNPEWQLDQRPAPDQETEPLQFDLPDVEQSDIGQGFISDLKITAYPAEAGGSILTIETNTLGPSVPPPDPYSGWQHHLPLPDGTEQWRAGITVDGDRGELGLSASYVVPDVGLLDVYRDDYFALLEERGLLVESESPTADGSGIELSASGHPRFATVNIYACCTEPRQHRNSTVLNITGVVML